MLPTRSLAAAGIALLALTPSSWSAEAARFDFRRDPERQGFVVTGVDDGRFDWSRGRELDVLLDSNAPGARLGAPLGTTLDGADSFVVEMDFRLDAIDASPDDFFQVSFGLVSSATTGLNRTGTSLSAPPFFVDDADTWDSLELAYYPNVTFFGGPFLQPTVFGANVGSPFSNFAANFGPSSDLGDNTGDQVTELPQDVPLRVRMVHDACRQRLVTTIFDLSGGQPAELETGIAPLDLSFLNATGTFHVDTLALNAYQDLADFDPSSRSLLARVAFLAARVLVLDAPSAIVLPRTLHASADGDALVRIDGHAGLGAVTLVEVAGAPVSLALAPHVTGQGSLLVRVPRALAAAGGLVLDVGGCLVPVDGPSRVLP